VLYGCCNIPTGRSCIYKLANERKSHVGLAPLFCVRITYDNIICNVIIYVLLFNSVEQDFDSVFIFSGTPPGELTVYSVRYYIEL